MGGEREKTLAFCQAPHLADEGGKSILCTQRNRRRDGTLFWNMFLLRKFVIGEHCYIAGLQKEVAEPCVDQVDNPSKVELESLMDIILFDQRPSSSIVQTSSWILAGWTVHSAPLGQEQADTSFETYVTSLPNNGATVADLPKYWAHKLPNHHHVSGTVNKGFGRGAKELGFPTANLELDDTQLAGMQRGIYAGFASVDGGKAYMAVVSVGLNPCFDDVEKPLLEAYLVHEFESDFYGAQL